jgi:transcriptional regulator with XRE-family HTH domain
MSNIRIGNKIKEIRKEKGLSQSEFGVLIDYANKSLVSRWENGVILPNNHRQKLIADLANKEVSEIFDNTSNISFSSNEIEFYLKQFEKRWNEIINHHSDDYGESYGKLVKDINVDGMKNELIKEIVTLPHSIEVDYDGTEFIGDSEEFKKEHIIAIIDQIIYSELNKVKNSIPENDAEALHKVKRDIIEVEEKLKSYYLGTSDNEVTNENLNRNIYNEISGVLKDTIFNLVRLEEYI